MANFKSKTFFNLRVWAAGRKAPSSPPPPLNQLKKIARNRVKSLDSFSQPIELSYKGDTKYSTFIGGLTTIFILLIMVIYGASLFIALIRRSETRKSKNTIVNDLSKSPPVYEINEENFGLAHIALYNSSIPINDESYFNVRYYQVTETLNDSGIFRGEVEYNHSI